MRSDETKAVTITLPAALLKAVRTLADRDHCGNISAVMRKVLYKEVGLEASLELKAGDMEQISQAEARSEKYKVNGLRKKSK